MSFNLKKNKNTSIIKKRCNMAFCKFSTENKQANEVLVDSVFFTDYMPYAPESCTKVYLYGLAKCSNPDSNLNSIEDFVQVLNLSKEDIKSAYLYWEEKGLVKILNIEPIEIRYLPVKRNSAYEKLYKKEKFAEFNRTIQEILDGRMITPHEYSEYYITMDSMHIDESAMLMIAKYCAESKGNNVGYNYILTVAKNWAYDGVHTAKDVELKLGEMETLTNEVKDILVALKSKKSPSFEDKELFQKWTKQYGYDLSTLVQIAKKVKRGGMDKLASLIDTYYGLKLFSITEIEDYEKDKDSLYSLAKTVCQSLGLYYENLDPIVNTYIIKWKQMGYSQEAIKLIADICFKKFIRNFDGMNEIVSKYFANGLISLDAINEYITGTLSTDKKIKNILANLGLARNVTSWDRDYYHTWTYSWKFGDELIDYATSLSAGKSQPMTYINKILSNWKEQNITTLEDAKKAKSVDAVLNNNDTKSQQKSHFITHSFSQEELDALFDNLDEVKLV